MKKNIEIELRLDSYRDANAPYHSTYFQYFDSHGKLLPRPVRVRIDLDPPFKAGEKAMRIVGKGPLGHEVSSSADGDRDR